MLWITDLNDSQRFWKFTNKCLENAHHSTKTPSLFGATHNLHASILCSVHVKNSKLFRFMGGKLYLHWAELADRLFLEGSLVIFPLKDTSLFSNGNCSSWAWCENHSALLTLHWKVLTVPASSSAWAHYLSHTAGLRAQRSPPSGNLCLTLPLIRSACGASAPTHRHINT